MKIKTGTWQWRGDHRVRSISCGTLAGEETNQGGRYSITVSVGLDPVTSPTFRFDHDAKAWLRNRSDWEERHD